MNCQDFTLLVSEFLDGELDAVQASALTVHAAACARCNALLVTTRQMLLLLSSERAPAMPEAAAQRLRQALEKGTGEPLVPAAGLRSLSDRSSVRQMRPGKHRAWGFPAGAWAAAAAAVVLLTVGTLRWRAGATTLSGWLIDAHCYAAYRNHPGDHPRDCLLKCAKFGYGLEDAQGKFHPFNAHGDQVAMAAIRASRKKDHMWVKIEATHGSGNRLDVEQLALVTPGTR